MAAIALVAAPVLGHARTSRHVRADVVSGSPEINRTPSGELKRWRRPQITVHVDSSVDALGAGARETVIQAFGAWQGSGADLPQVTVATTTDAAPAAVQDGQNTVVLAPIDITGHEHDLAVTVTYSDSETGEIMEADIIVNARHSFSLLPADVEGSHLTRYHHEDGRDRGHDERSDHDGDGDHGEPDLGGDAQVLEIASCSGLGREGAACDYAYDFQNILTHEVGHFYGLGEDRDDPHATMFFCTSQCETHKRSLAESDVEALTEVYAGGFDDEPEARCSVGSVPASSGGLALGWVGLGLLGVVALRRRRAG